MRPRSKHNEFQAFKPWHTLLLGLVVLTISCVLAGTAWASGSPSWSEPIQIDSTGLWVTSLSCPAESFCMAVEPAGNAIEYNGSSWKTMAGATEGHMPTEISCASATFCVVADDSGYVSIWSKNSWKSELLETKEEQVDWVSCPSESFCVVVAQGGNTYTFDGSSWSAPVSVGPKDSESAFVSCVSTSFCVATYSAGSVSHYNGSSWSPLAVVSPSTYLLNVSCVSDTFCMAAYRGERAYEYNNGAWEEFTKVGKGWLTAVSCTAETFCMMIGNNDEVMAFNGSSWSEATNLGNEVFFQTLSCASSTFCVAAGSGGQGRIYSVEPVPQNTVLPQVKGIPKQGQTLSVVKGSWTHVDTEAGVGYQWERCGVSTESCEAVSGATAEAYLLTAEDDGYMMRVTETVWNYRHEGNSASSEPTVVVQAEEVRKEEAVAKETPTRKEEPNAKEEKPILREAPTYAKAPKHHTAIKCVVPRLKGKTRQQAVKMLRHHHCRLGSVTHGHSRHHAHNRHHRRHRVVGQDPKPHTVLRKGARVSVRVS